MDSINYFYSVGNLMTIYIILDTSVLAEGQKDSFPNAGIYVKRGSDSAYVYYNSVKVQGGAVSWTRLYEAFLPIKTQGKDIADSNNYFSTKTVEGALDQIGGQLSSKELILDSSTADSTKKFKLTVDDTGTVTATEINET